MKCLHCNKLIIILPWLTFCSFLIHNRYRSHKLRNRGPCKQNDNNRLLAKGLQIIVRQSSHCRKSLVTSLGDCSDVRVQRLKDCNSSWRTKSFFYRITHISGLNYTRLLVWEGVFFLYFKSSYSLYGVKFLEMNSFDL